MKIKDIKNYIKNFEDYNIDEEYKIEDFLNFLLNSSIETIPTHIFNNKIWLNSLILPKKCLKDDYVNELINWEIDYNNGYSYWSSRSSKELSDPYDGDSPKFLSSGEPIFFFRDIFNNTDSIIEFNQKIAHILDVSFYEPKKSFCKLDKNGDYFTVAKIEDSKNLRLCTITKDDLFFYLYLTDSVLIRFFQAERWDGNSWNFGSRSDEEEYPVTDNKNEIYANLNYKKDDNGKILYSFLRGFQIIKNNISDEVMNNKLNGIAEEREYIDFLIHDWKNKKIIEWSSNPEKIGNYFIESNLPYGTSPIYFKPEVLSKYKSDPEKYSFELGSIICMGTWTLKYDVNDENQIIIYLKDISGLPYNEQLYWKSFNEKPKAGLPEHMIKSDFEGDWGYDYSHPLQSLKQNLGNLPQIHIDGNKFNIWELKSSSPTKNIKNLDYVLTDSKKEWEDQINLLYQIVIEGLNSKTINKLAKKLECHEKCLKSIKQLKKCLKKKEIPESTIDCIITPLIELNDYRRFITAHNTNEEYPDGDLKENYGNLLEKCSNSIKKLSEIIEDHILDVN
ncbi:MAG: hypothetical protein LBM96_08720 [Methanobrevibacter sp.]|jgi:hypothetical protein|nr:hypothetical protein [Candidatus Methanoflexus mossambicus]